MLFLLNQSVRKIYFISQNRFNILINDDMSILLYAIRPLYFHGGEKCCFIITVLAKDIISNVGSKHNYFVPVNFSMVIVSIEGGF